jgi:THO complex subunit 4
MADKMDRGLDEIIADTRSNRPRNNRGQGRRREPRNDFPRDGVRKVRICAIPVIMRLC